MKKKFIDKWWVRVVGLLVIPGLLSGGSSTAWSFIFLTLLLLLLIRVFANSSRSRRLASGIDVASQTNSTNNQRNVRPSPPTSKSKLPAEGTYILLESSGSYSVGLAGESNYFEAISMAANRRSGEHLAIAEIIREPDNKFDTNAVRVEIDGRTVGYIPREEAPSFHALLSYGASLNKRVFVSCRVWVSDEDDSYGSVSLDIDDPNSALPPINATEVPAAAVIWPIGNTLQVSEESKNLENVKIIFEKMREAVSRTILLELVIDRTKSEKPEVHVLFNGTKVGELSPVSGKKFLPAIEKATSHGKRLFVRGEAIGNSLAAEIKIFAKTPELLSEKEVTQLLG
jgi:hypothetical protein